MFEVEAIIVDNNHAIIAPLPKRREWMDLSKDGHAYRCFPLSLVNNLGWSISFPEDITFIWDGNTDMHPDHVKVLSGGTYAHSGRGNNLITFKTNIMFRTSENLSLLVQPVPNSWIDGVQPLSVILSTSFLKGHLEPSAKITKANEIITIKAGTPILSVLPINLEDFNNSVMIVKNGINFPEQEIKNSKEYEDFLTETHKKGLWSNFYKNGIDHLGNIIGKHQVKKILLHVKSSDPSDDIITK